MAFTHRQPVLTLGEIAEKSSLPKPTAHRLIRSLISRGLMQRTVDGRYELGFRVYELGMIARNRISLTTLASSAIETLSAETGETVILSRADVDTSEVVAVDSRIPTHALGVRPLDGRRSLVPPGPQGKALLAALTPGELNRVLDTYARRGPEERQLIETGRFSRRSNVPGNEDTRLTNKTHRRCDWCFIVARLWKSALYRRDRSGGTE